MPDEPTYTVHVNGHAAARGLSELQAYREAEATESLRPDARVTVRPELP